jgi:hypothetical protein
VLEETAAFNPIHCLALRGSATVGTLDSLDNNVEQDSVVVVQAASLLRPSFVDRQAACTTEIQQQVSSPRSMYLPRKLRKWRCPIRPRLNDLR